MKNVKKLNEIIKTIAKKARPEKIYLFGSRVNGKATKNSDYDILVIKKTNQSKYKRTVFIYKLFGLLDISVDILVYTPKEVEMWKDASASFIHHILKTGKLVYEK